MSELREFLGEHNMGITTLAKLIGLSRDTIRRYEVDPERCTEDSRRKIEVALKIIREENWMRPYLKKQVLVDSKEHYCLREAHLREVVIFEREFKTRYREVLAQNT